MGENNTFILIGIFIFIVILLSISVMLIVKEKSKKKERGNYYVKGKSGGRDYLRSVQKFYRSIPILNRFYKKTKTRVKIIYPADNYSINKETSKILAKGTLIWVGIGIFIILTCKLDVFYFCFGFVIDTVLLTSYVDRKLDMEELKVLSQLDMLITKIRHYYENKRDPVYALEMALLDVPRLIGLHAQNIYDIITNPKMKEAIDKYAGSEPNQYVMMLLQICASVKEKGDKRLPDGRTVFTANLDSLKTDVNAEKLNKENNIDAFRGITILSIAPLLGIKPYESYVKNYITDMADFYSGVNGKVCMVLVFLICISVYTIIITLRDQYREIEKENNVFARLAQVEPISSFIDKYITLHYTKYRRYNEYKNGIGDHTGPKALLLKQIILATITFVSIAFIFIGGCISQSYQSIHDWSEVYADESLTGSDEYKEQLRQTSEKMTIKYKGKDITEEKISEELFDSGKVGKKMDADTVAKNIVSRINENKNIYFKWWYLVIATIGSVIAFYVPIWILKFKKQVIEMRQREEIIQFQSLMMILVYIPGTGVPEILDWMERFSSVFKMEVARCRVDINANQKRALKALKNDTNYEPLKDFVDNLMAIDKVGTEAAFAEINGDRVHFQMERDRMNNMNRKRRARKANLIALVPLLSMIFIYIVAPMFVYGFNMLTSMTSTISGL